MYEGCTVLQISSGISATALLHQNTVILMPLFEATYVQGFITSLTSKLHLQLFLQSVVAVDAVELLVLNDGHDTPTDHSFSSAVLITLAALLRRLALHVTQKHLRYLDDELASGQLLSVDPASLKSHSYRV